MAAKKVSKPVKKIKTAIEQVKVPVMKKGLSKKVYILLAVVILAALVYLGRGLLVVALVNNQPISRLSLIRELEKSSGGQFLDQKIDELLILQAGQKQNVVVTESEIADKIKEIEASLTEQGQNLPDILKAQGISPEELDKQIKIQLMIEKLLAGKVEVSQEEISQAFEENSQYYPEGTVLEDVQAEIETGLQQQKLGQQYQTWLEELRQQAKIHYFVNY